jgi:hypothetical protein
MEQRADCWRVAEGEQVQKPDTTSDAPPFHASARCGMDEKAPGCGSNEGTPRRQKAARQARTD